MEFYGIPKNKIFQIIRFQFPTGWNSTIGSDLMSLVVNGFNSQRDGILLIGVHRWIPMLVFQFPTGWNSTFDSDYFVGIGVVSIPNGMEFYGFYRYFEPD